MWNYKKVFIFHLWWEQIKNFIKPQTVVGCHAKLSPSFQRKSGNIIEIQNICKFINEEPGLFIKESVDKIRVNRSKKAYALKRGFVIGKARCDKSEININTSNNNSKDFKEIDVSEE